VTATELRAGGDRDPVRQSGIRSNVLLPSATESPMQARWQADPDLKRRTAASVPLGRVGTTQDRTDASSCSRTAPRSSPTASFWSVAEGWRCRERT